MSRHETIPGPALNRRALDKAAERAIWLLGPQESPAPDLAAELAVLSAYGRVGIANLFERFALDAAERDLFLLAAAAELGPAAAAALAAHPLALRGRATPALADLVLGPGAAARLGPVGHLRQSALVEAGPGGGLAQRPVWVDDAVACCLLGAPQPSEALAAALLPLAPATAGDDVLASALAEAIRAARRHQAHPLIHLCGNRRHEAEAMAAGAFAALGLRAFGLEPDRTDLPCDRLAALINRDLVFLEGGLVLRDTAAGDLADRLTVPLFLWGTAPPETRRPIAGVTMPPPAPSPDLPVAVALGARDLRDAQATRDLGLAPDLWTTLRGRAASGLDDLAQRIEPQARWEDLVLPEAQLAQLRQMTAFRRNAGRVLGDWGFRARSARGLGLAALFSGPSGTGKTMAAEIVAAVLGPPDAPLSLYRVDLSAVVSKYIGETEKNIGRIFDAAEGSGAVLIFDEGEALFGKRSSDVKDSLDRHANTETAYLLQRLETYTGCAIVTTNLKGTVDEAFLRRFRLVVDFPFPNAELRARIWQSVFPPETPTEGLDFAALSRHAVAGGFIRSIALTAAFLASEAGTPVRRSHIELAVRQEYGKLGKPLSESELRGFR